MTTSDSIQPFEWLTSPESLMGLIQENVIAATSQERQERCGNSKATQVNANGTDRTMMPMTALHIGCGSSTVGEYLVEKLGFDAVVNVDRDRETLDRMKSRWTNNNDASINSNKMEFLCLDYTKETLPDRYVNYFDFVIDKSTLDCTLCSGSAATASFLIEVYRTLKKKPARSSSMGDGNSCRSNGGVYMIITFNELDLILSLLRNMPGARWTVAHTCIERQVEVVSKDTNNDNNDEDNVVLSQQPTDTGIGGREETQASSLNVLFARCNGDVESSSLDYDAVCRHVTAVNDQWFQEKQPLLTNQRIQDLKLAFSIQSPTPKKVIAESKAKVSTNKKRGGGDETKSKILSLEEAYKVIFTQGEREHLTYEHFLEDWLAFLEDKVGKEEPNLRWRLSDDESTTNTPMTGIGITAKPTEKHNGNSATIGMTYDLAIDFLRVNQ